MGLAERTGVELTFGQERQGVRGVASDTTLNRFDPFPFSLRGLDLQTSHMLGEEQRQATEIRMAALGVGLGFVPFLLRPDVVDHVPEVVVRDLVVRVGVDEVILRQFEDDGDKGEEFLGHLLPELAVELRDLGVVLFDNRVFAHGVPVRDGLGDVELR